MLKIIKLLAIGISLILILSTCISADKILKENNIIKFSDISKTDRSVTIPLPIDAKCSYFGLQLNGPIERGPEQPQNITLDIGDNGTIDWAFNYQYGPLGYQNVFGQGERKLMLEFDPNIIKNSESNGFYLPVTAEVEKAAVKFEFIGEDYLSSIIELNRPEWHPEAPYDYDPELCVYQDKLYVVYRSYSWRDTNQSDADIVLNSTEDGFIWQNNITELTKVPDTEVPYLGGKRAGDFYPSMAVFKNKLYCAWESASVLPIGSTHGEDRDIVYTIFDGNHWTETIELTAPNEQAAEDIYSKNPGVKDDYRVQLCAFNNGSGEQLFAVWTANNTGDEWFPEERKGDIIVSKTIDGITWSIGQDLTENDRRYDEDYLPQLVEFKTTNGNALFVFWVSNNVANTNGSDWDIVYRYSLDGLTWSEQHNLLRDIGVVEPKDVEEAIDDDPALIVYNNRLYVLWRTSNPELGNGNDIDIVMSSTADGLNWTKPVEVTSKTDTMFNNRPRATVYSDNLAILWRTVESKDEGCLVLRLFDNKTQQLSNAIKVTPLNAGGNDYSPDIISFKDQLFVSWVTEDNITTKGLDSDVVIRRIIPQNGTPVIALDLGKTGENDDNWIIKNFKPEPGKIFDIELTNRLNELLSNNYWVKSNKIKDEFRNELFFIPINCYFSGPGSVQFTSLEIQYNYSFFIPDLSVSLNAYLKDQSEKNMENDNNKFDVILRFESNTNGKILINTIIIEYTTSTNTRGYPELICIAVLGVILIILGIIIRLAKIRPKKAKKRKHD